MPGIRSALSIIGLLALMLLSPPRVQSFAIVDWVDRRCKIRLLDTASMNFGTEFTQFGSESRLDDPGITDLQPVLKRQSTKRPQHQILRCVNLRKLADELALGLFRQRH
jgi:hypothetical protein